MAAKNVKGALRPLSDDPERLREVIWHMRGNLTRAATRLDVSKQHVMNLIRKWGLNDWAKRVRVLNGNPPTGNPLRKRQPKKKILQAVAA